MCDEVKVPPCPWCGAVVWKRGNGWTRWECGTTTGKRSERCQRNEIVNRLASLESAAREVIRIWRGKDHWEQISDAELCVVMRAMQTMLDAKGPI